MANPKSLCQIQEQQWVKGSEGRNESRSGDIDSAKVEKEYMRLGKDDTGNVSFR